nr:leucine-rich repeat protein [Tanacetum cinerariifolium]
KRFSVRAKETTGWIPDFDEQEEDNSESKDKQSVGFIKEDFDGSDAEKEGDNNVSMVPDSVTEDVNVQAEEKEVECDKKSMGNNEGSGFGNEKGESVSIGSRKRNKIDIKRTGGGFVINCYGGIDEGGKDDGLQYGRISAKKMSKLDWFLMLEGLLGVNPNFSALTLDRIETTEERTQILATVDGIHRTVTESSLRRNLKLRDEEGIRFNEFSSNIATALGEGSCTPTEPHHTPSPEAQPPSHTTHSSSTLPPITTTSIPFVTLSETTPIRQYTRRARIAQSSALPTVADEPESPLRDISQGEACPTDSGFIADQDRVTIAKSSTLPHDSAPRVTSPAVDEGSMQQIISELTALCTSLQRQHSELLAKFQAQEVEINRLKERVKLLEDRDGVATKRSGDDAPIKGRSVDEGEAAAERISDDSEEMATVLTSMDATIVLAGELLMFPLLVSLLMKFPLAMMWFPLLKVQEQIDAQVARELEEQLEREDQRRSAQIARNAKIARIHIEEELHIMIDELINDLVKYQDNYTKVHKFQSQQRKPWTKKQKRDYYMAVIRSNLRWKVKDFRGMTFEEVEAKFNIVWKQLEDFIPMGSKEEAERFKRKEKVKEMMQLVPIEEVYVESLQVKHPIIDWKVYTKGQRSYWKITRLGGSSASYQFFIDLLKHLDREDLNQLWRLVKETLSNRPPTIEWKLYDSCGVHHVKSKKDYPLRKGLALVMISYKLQVENYSQMGRIVGNKMHKAFPLPFIEFPLAEELPTASEEGCHCQKKSEATAVKIALLSIVKKKMSVKVK